MVNGRVTVSVFFWLRFNEGKLLGLLKKAGFQEMAIRLPSVPLLPGIKLEMSLAPKPLATYGSVKASWHGEKFSLIFDGPVDELREALTRFTKATEDSDYALQDVVNYCEIIVANWEIRRENLLLSLRNKLKFRLKLHEEEFDVFSVSFSNRPSPVSTENFYKWCHVKLEPDVHAPDKIFYITIIRRVRKLKEALEFISRLDKHIEEIIAQLTR